MLPKERVIAALEHREADRVPVGEIVADWEITEAALGRQTYAHSKWREWTAVWEGRRDEVVASYKRDLVDLTRRFEWDFALVPLVPARKAQHKPPELLGNYTWRDEAGKVWRYSPESGGLPMVIEAPPIGIDDIKIPDKVDVDESRLEAAVHVVKELGGTHFVFGQVPDGTFPWQETTGLLEEYLVKMLTEPAFAEKAVALHLKTALAWIEAMCAVGVDGILVARDYCDNRGPLMGPRLFRQFLLPAFKAMVRAVRARGKFFMKHTDGFTWPILDDFVEAGVHAWQGIQPRIGMDLKRLKEKYTGRLCFFGGVDVDTLVLGTPQAVADEVKYAIRHAARGGGLVITSGNSLMVGTKWDNYQALLRATREYGRYPITL